MSEVSWSIFAAVQILFWLGFAVGHNVGKQDKENP